jgi:hypothetical protein
MDDGFWSATNPVTVRQSSMNLLEMPELAEMPGFFKPHDWPLDLIV